MLLPWLLVLFVVFLAVLGAWRYAKTRLDQERPDHS